MGSNKEVHPQKAVFPSLGKEGSRWIKHTKLRQGSEVMRALSVTICNPDILIPSLGAL